MKKKIVLKEKPAKANTTLSPAQVIQEESRRLEEKLNCLKSKLASEKAAQPKSQRFGKSTLLKKGLKEQFMRRQAEVGSFLAELKLGQYTDLFFSNGFNDMETVREIKSHHLQAMAVPLGHQIKLLKAITVTPEPEPHRQSVELRGIQTEVQEIAVCRGCYRKFIGAQRFCSAQCEAKERELDCGGQQPEEQQVDAVAEQSQGEGRAEGLDNSFIEYEKYVSQSQFQVSLPREEEVSEPDDLQELRQLLQRAGRSD